MKLLLLALFGTLVWLRVPDSGYEITKLRNLYLQARDSEKAGKQLYEQMQHYAGDDALLIAYRAAAQAVKAKYAGNPLQKRRFISRSESTFSRAVKLAPQQSEIRFLRYTVESNTPKFMNKSKHLKEDREFLIRSVEQYPQSDLTEETKNIIIGFMLEDDDCTEAEKQLLQKYKS